MVTTCPNAEVLQRFLLGQMSLDEHDQLAGHVEECSQCIQTLHGLQVRDPLLEAMQTPLPERTLQGTGLDASPPGGFPAWSPLPGPGFQDQTLEQLLNRLVQLVPMEPRTLAFPPQEARSELAEKDIEEAQSLLAPALEPNELGRLGPYRVLQVLGRGGMGVVFLAEDVLLKRKVALKVLLPARTAAEASRKRFLREAQSTAALEHDHIVPIYQVGEERGVPYLAMQLLKGESLEQRLLRLGRLPAAEVIRIGREVALGLAAAHEVGLIHRDIKPANLWMETRDEPRPSESGASAALPNGHSSSWRVKILDFGLVRAAGDEGQMTQTGFIVGTPAYMAPEQARAETVDARCDLFSLGCVLYRTATGEAPFQAKDLTSTLLALAMDQPKPPRDLNPEVPPALNDLVLRLLAKDPADRPASAREVADRLQAIERQLTAPPAAAPPATEVLPAAALPSPSRPPAARARRWRRRGLVAAAALAALLPLGYFFGGTVLRFATNQGQIVIEVDDPRMEVTVKEKGTLIRDPQGQRTITLTAGGHDLEVTVKEASGETRFFTSQFTVSRGGKQVLNVRQELARTRPAQQLPGPGAKPAAEAGDAERRAAEWVLSSGRSKMVVRFAGGERDVQAIKDLPAGAFQVVSIIFGDQSVTDAGLAHLKPLTNLTTLSLWTAMRVGDAGLAHLQTLTNLTLLNLNATQVTDAGLAHLKPLTKLTYLNLAGTQISDAGLVHLKTLTKLRDLNLDGTRVSDAGLVHLKTLTNLTVLSLNHTQVSDAGLAHLKTLTNLTQLGLDATPVTDGGLAHLKPLTKLTALTLTGTQISDAGLPQLATLPALRGLSIAGTRVSARGFATLKAALPAAHLTWSEPNRTAAEGVLALGGTILIRPKGQRDDRLVKAAADLPAEYFRLTRVNLAGIHKPLGTLGSQLGALTDPEFDQLEGLDLSGTAVTDADLLALRGLAKLLDLSLARTQVSDAGLASLKGLPKLRRLVLDGTPVNGRGLDHLKELPALTDLRLGCPALSDLFLPHLAELKQLERLALAGSSATDEGLKLLHGLTALRELDLTGTKVTAAGVEAFKKAVPKCMVFSGPAAKPAAEASDAERRAAEWVLSFGKSKIGVRFAGGERDVQAVKDLPEGAFQVVSIFFGDQSVTDAGLAHLKPLTNLTTLRTVRQNLLAFSS